jgi:hypothetical protein
MLLPNIRTSQRACVAPCEVDRARRDPRRLVELLRKTSIVWCILGVHSDESVCICLDGTNEGFVRRRGALVCAHGDVRHEKREERLGGRGDRKRLLLIPDVKGVVELLRHGEASEIPRVAVVVDVLLVPSDGHGLIFRNACVDGVHRAEAVDINKEVRECLIRAGLERRRVATCGSIKRVDRSEHRICVDTGPVPLVRDDVLAIPVGLQEAQGIRCLSRVQRTVLAKRGSERGTLAQRAMLRGRCKER